jgi:hypothetical protein
MARLVTKGADSVTLGLFGDTNIGCSPEVQDAGLGIAPRRLAFPVRMMRLGASEKGVTAMSLLVVESIVCGVGSFSVAGVSGLIALRFARERRQLQERVRVLEARLGEVTQV